MWIPRTTLERDLGGAAAPAGPAAPDAPERPGAVGPPGPVRSSSGWLGSDGGGPSPATSCGSPCKSCVRAVGDGAWTSGGAHEDRTLSRYANRVQSRRIVGRYLGGGGSVGAGWRPENVAIVFSPSASAKSSTR